jgi:hypothetical protein
MHILKNEFELSIDIEGLLNLNSSSEGLDDNLYFAQFKELFDQEVGLSNRNSVLSVIHQ